MSRNYGRTCYIAVVEGEDEVSFDPDDYVDDCSDTALVDELKGRGYTVTLDSSDGSQLATIKQILGIQQWQPMERVIQEIKLLYGVFE